MSALRCPNDISSMADNAIFKNRVQNMDCSLGCVARNVVLFKPNVANILLFNFCEQKFVQHGPLTIANNCNGLSLLIFQEKWSTQMALEQNPHKTVTRGFSMDACGFSVPQMGDNFACLHTRQY